ncbi:MATE family efflux transporter [Faecalibacterium prausnitzii]|uniref:MATE family efflux transporter n=1 Tax=Faecalibacterium prausnitzii TaxID=853 RepID=UPI003C2BE518
MNLTKQFFKYVSQNIFGLLGTSCYILADTYFISQAAGTDGVTLLNLCLPVYNFIFAVGSMVGLGAATRYAILRAQGDARAQRYFSNAIFSVCILAVPFLLVGIFAPGGLLRLMGGDAGIMALGIPYARIFLMFTPFFMCNYIVSAFVRNDGDPSLAMVATLSSSLFNVVFDYIFMFPMGLGLAGAALATAISPILSIAVCSAHFIKKSNTITFVRKAPSVRLLGQSCQLGISGFVGEMSSGVTTTVFNFLLLGLAGNVAVAAYGVVANFALVATAIFNGVAQGAQPLVSECYGKNEMAGARKLLLLGCGTALGLAALLYGVVFGYTDALTALFNSENSALMAEFAHSGMRIYFVGYFFAGFNIVAAGYLSATNRPVEASVTSICRGMVAIVVCSLVLSALFGMNGVWAAFPVSEAITLALTVFLLKRKAGRA